MFLKITLLVLALTFKNSLQSCSSTVAITACTWDSLKSSKPLQVTDYKTHLSFSKGNLETIPNGAFKLFPQVTILQLNNNKIKHLEEQSLEGLINLKQLTVYDNQLTALNQHSLKYCSNLEKLDLGMNKISFIHEKALEHLQKLVYLNLAFNSLQAVPSALNFALNLKHLRLDNNAIGNLKANTFSELSKLKELTINDNKLTKIEQDGFKGLSNLNKLDLSSNFLTDINVADLVDDAKQLNLIRISINSFRCDSLQKVLESFRKNNVEVSRGVSRSPSSVNGISCKTS